MEVREKKVKFATLN